MTKQFTTKQTIIFVIVLTASLVIAMQVFNHFVHGQEDTQLDPNNYLTNTRDENKHNDNNGIGQLLKHKGDLYCYDSNTTGTKEVKNWVSKKDYKTSDYPKQFNDFLADTLKSNKNMSQVKEMCDNMVDLYIITKEDYHQRESLIPDNDLELELELEFEWEIIK